MAVFPDSIFTSKILQRFSRRSFVGKLATGAALVAMPAIPEAVAAPPADPRELALFHAHKMAEALNALTGGAWEVNLKIINDADSAIGSWALLVDRGTPGKVGGKVEL